MEKLKRARKRKLETDQGGPEAILSQYSGGQGVHREVESEGHEEKPRAVIKGGYPDDEPVSQRWRQVELELRKRRVPLSTQELIEELNPVLRGWGHYYKRAHVRRLFHRLDCWIVRRIWSHRCKRWRNMGWKQLPWATLYSQYGLVTLVGLIPVRASHQR